MRRRPTLLIALFALFAGLLLGGSVVAAAAPKDPCDKLFSKSTTAKLKVYTACREDRQDAALKRIESQLAAMGTPGAAPSPTAPPTPPSPSPSPKPAQPTAADGAPAGPASTGVPDGTTLTAYTGPSTITAAGTVIDAKKITTCLVIKADNVTIKNSLLQAGGCFFNVLSDDGSTGLTLTDVEIDGQNNKTGDSAVSGGGYTCLRCDVHGTIDGFKAGTDVTIKDSWIHDLAMTADSHNDGIQSLGTTKLAITGNTIVLADGATSAVILSTGSASDMRNITISGNLLGGGAFTVYGGYAAGTDTKSKISNIAITDNRFSTKIHPTSGAFGPLTSTDAPVSVSGNTWADGPDAGRSVS